MQKCRQAHKHSILDSICTCYNFSSRWKDFKDMAIDNLNDTTNGSKQSTSWDDIEFEDPDRKYDHKMYQSAIAFYGHLPTWERTFTKHLMTDKNTGAPILDEKTGKQKTALHSCNPSTACLQGNAVWTQVNPPFEGTAIWTSKDGKYSGPKKATNRDIQFIRNVTLDFEYPKAPHTAHAVAHRLVHYLASIGLCKPDHPIEDTGGGVHIGLPIVQIESTPEISTLWNGAVARVVKSLILPEFNRLCQGAGIVMDLEGYDISRILSFPGTWRPTNPDKEDAGFLKDGYLRRWLEPYTDENYPVRKENEKLTQLIQEAFTKLQNESQESTKKGKDYLKSNPRVSPNDLPDDALIQKIMQSTNGAEFTRLWYGDVGTDWSSADLALCNYLAFWTGKDASRMDSLFRQSGLMRPKWDRAARTGDDSYGAGTIERAIEGCDGTYDPNFGKDKAEDEEVDTSDLDKAIEDLDHDAIMRNAHVLARMPKYEANIYLKRIKDKFGKDINQNHLQEAIKEARKKIAMEEFEEQPGTSLDALADDFAAQYGDIWAYNALTSIWYRWNGTHWQDMQDVEAQKRSCVSLDRIVRDLMLAKEMAIDKTSDLDGVVRLACIHCVRSFRQKSNLVNFKNGTLDIDTGELRAHDKADELTYCLPYEYNEHGEWPTICAFLRKLFPDKYARQNFMVHIGLSLIGDTKMHFACAIIGAPRTGKSVGLNLANMTCGIEEGRYSGKTLFDTDLEGKRVRFMQNKKRIVCVDELPAETLRNEETFKNMTAHSGVEMRGMYKDDEISNRWGPKILMAMNERPEYKDTTGAIKERLVPLLVGETIARENRDIHMVLRFVPELGGFASSCIRLAKASLKNCFYPLSASMKQTINSMAKANNPLKSFLHEECMLDSQGFIVTHTLYERYKAYCLESGNKPLSKAKMSNELVEMKKGIYRKKDRNPLDKDKTEHGLGGLRWRRDTDEYAEDESEVNDSMLVADVADIMLVMLFGKCQQSKPSSEADSDSVADIADENLSKFAHTDPPIPSQNGHTHTHHVDIKGDRGMPIEGNRDDFSSATSANPVDEPVELPGFADVAADISDSDCQQSQQDENRPPKIVCPVCGKTKEVWNVTHWICGNTH